MADLSDVYTALQQADAAGDTAGAQQLADYIRTQGAGNETPPGRAGAKYPNSRSLDAGGQGQIIGPTGSPEAVAAQSPVDGNSFGQNAAIGVGNLYTGALLGMKQMAAQATGGDPNAQTDLNGNTEASRRALNQPLDSTWGGKTGEIAGALPLAFIPGANSWAGAAALGAATGAVQPTVGDESRLLNTGVGGALGLAGKGVGDKVSSWMTSRAAEPFMGWSPKTANRAAAEAVGSDASALDQAALGDTYKRLGSVFNRARDPMNYAGLGPQTAAELYTAARGLNQSTAQAFAGNASVVDLMTHLRAGSANAQQLGQISSELGTEAASQMGSKTGDRALGKALFSVKEHVDDLVGSTIQDPALASAYQTARGQYRNLSNITANSSILNSSTGDVNMTALGKRLQRVDKPGYLRGGNDSDLYNAARWGQASGQGKGAPELSLGNFGIPWLKYQAMNNPLTAAMGGATSRLGAPVAPQIGQGLQGLAMGALPAALPYLEN